MSTSIYVFSILALIVVGLVYFFYLRDKFQKAVIGHVWATFITETNARVDALCKVNGSVVTPPLGLLSDTSDPITYVIRGDKTANFRYPPLFPRALQATVRSVVYGEGNPEPFDPQNRPAVFSDKLFANLQNESATLLTMRGMIAATRSEDIMHALETAGNNKTLLYVSIGIIVAVGILGFLLYQLSGQVDSLAALWGL